MCIIGDEWMRGFGVSFLLVFIDAFFFLSLEILFEKTLLA